MKYHDDQDREQVRNTIASLAMQMYLKFNLDVVFLYYSQPSGPHLKPKLPTIPEIAKLSVELADEMVKELFKECNL